MTKFTVEFEFNHTTNMLGATICKRYDEKLLEIFSKKDFKSNGLMRDWVSKTLGKLVLEEYPN